MERNKVLNEFGLRVRTARTEKALSQEALADICQMDRTYISGVERGVRNPSLTAIFKIASGLGVDAGTLVQGLSKQEKKKVSD